MKTLLFIGAGGFLGSVSRYLLTRIIETNSNSSFPFGTMVVNIVGCFVVGVLYGLTENEKMPSGNVQAFFTIGFCGGFTTFSSFVHENYTLFSDANFMHFALYSVLSFTFGLFAAYLGHFVIKMV